ncbi:Similar to PGAP3: Post-GPI attachment to proteins factor 3 (Drosophila melanogaster) [Cotesia congregata]|uniref:Post-GPI attachment to proteins factor 3 n=1 Tax=Cotesia congregata TaxID=51543 RepID=A0A8J2HAA7_COTCN|nr:Similar to PGAP3: Post-GPI attachment to proteins factor 3 (Drosophila melanogaster) [Cotesia congregata]
MTNFYLFLLISAFIYENVSASTGDRSQFYRQCLIVCYSTSCKHNVEFEVVSFEDGGFLSWSCEENCRYDCMWETVNHFVDHGHHVPQFHGKICLNAWFWSAVFHARDKPFTEVMDYSCAFTMVITLLFCMLTRILHKNNKILAVITFGYICILVTHLSHLWSGSINYGYNMKINIFFGFLTFLITMIWWYRNSSKLSHSYLIGWFTILTVAVTLLEVADFPPIFWTLDAHALWHASTAPLVYLLYKFIISDCHYLRKQYSYQVISDIHID